MGYKAWYFVLEGGFAHSSCSAWLCLDVCISLNNCGRVISPWFWQCITHRFHLNTTSLARQTPGAGFEFLWTSVFDVSAYVWAAVLLRIDLTTMGYVCVPHDRPSHGHGTPGSLCLILTSAVGFPSHSKHGHTEWNVSSVLACHIVRGQMGLCQAAGKLFQYGIVPAHNAKSVCMALPLWLPMSWRCGEADKSFLSEDENMSWCFQRSKTEMLR